MRTKPEWADAPDWANFLAMDFDGTWWWFEDEPEMEMDVDVWLANDGNMEEAEEGSWKDTLEKRPESE